MENSVHRNLDIINFMENSRALHQFGEYNDITIKGTQRSEQNGCDFADNIFKCSLSEENNIFRFKSISVMATSEYLN